MHFLRLFSSLFVLEFSSSLIISSCQYVAAPPKVLWKITADHMELPSYLFGTMHLPFAKIWNHLPIEVEQAFNHSSLIVLEMDLSDDYGIDQSNQKYTYLSSGKTLSDVVSKEVYANVKQYIDDYRIEKSRGFDYTRPMEPITNVEMLFLSGAYVFYKPYWVATYLVQAMTGTGDSGTLDATLAFKALEQNKQVKGIVTPDEQLSAFSWLDDGGYGEYVLNSTVNRLKADQKFYATCYDKLLSDYLCGTLFTQDRIFEEDEEDNQFREKYLHETLSKRNRLWLPRIDRILRSQTQVFFAFGIAHMVGEDSVVELLQKQGYTVTLYANDEYTNDSGVILPVSIGARPDRLSFDFFANDFGSPGGVEYSGVKSRSLSAGLSNSASSMMISCLFLITVWIF